MSKSLMSRLTSRFAAVAAIALAVQVASAAGPRLESFAKSDGTSVFAVCLPAVGEADSGPRDIVVAVDTSASHMGTHRAKALETLRGLLAALTAEDRVSILAVDIDATPLSSQFAPATAPQTAAALEKLQARAPLGATDMERALLGISAAMKSARQPRAAVYIGQGRSAANLLPVERFAELTGQLVAERVPVSSYAVGPRIDGQMLGALAARTGGRVIVDGEAMGVEKAASGLAAAIRGSVVYATAAEWSGVSEVYPKTLPPLRSDRDTVLIGAAAAAGPIGLTATLADSKTLSWKIDAAASNPDNSYLVQLVESARADEGASLPLVTAANLPEARDSLLNQSKMLSRLAVQAIKSGNATSAARMAEAALKLDANNEEAVSILGAAKKQGVKVKSIAAGAGDLLVAQAADAVPPPPAPEGEKGVKVEPAAPPAPVEALPAAPAAPGDINLVGKPEVPPPPAPVGPGGLVQSFEKERRAFVQSVQTDVQVRINSARQKVATSPTGAVQELKLLHEDIAHMPELSPEIRDELLRRVEVALQESQRRQQEQEIVRQRAQELAAAARDRQRLNDDLARKEVKLKALMDRVHSLMDEKRYREAEVVSIEAAAEASTNLERVVDNTTTVSSTLNARTIGYWDEAWATRIATQRAVIETLAQVDRSHIPFPDDPPIVYPDAQWFQEMSTRRRERYRSMDLANRGPAEKRIDEQLRSPTTLEFIDTPLQDVIDYLKDLHGIEIQLDKKKLEEANVQSDTPVTRNLKGISLRSALRLVLRELGLTYIVQDEVLLITSPEAAEEARLTKVYPVADLVLPVRTPSFQGGFGGLGGSESGVGNMGGGGMGGGLGGMGGGMGGGMMGGMGGGMGGMGGGMFNVPEKLRRAGVNLPAIPPGGFKAFSVKDDTAKPVAEAKPIVLETAGDPAASWDKHFAATKEDPAAVRATVRRLADAKKFNEAIDLILAALRNAQGQSWMYEALTLNLQLAERSKAEVERAVLSAADFAQSGTELMYLAQYLTTLGLDARAVKIFRQVARIEPTQPEPFVLGLRAAQRADDLEGMKWASLGIVRQAWPKDQLDVWKTGQRVAAAIVERLKGEKKAKEAAEFQAQIDQAMQRDCAIVITWSGEADVDLLVEEPAGTVCSFRSPRTTSGGVLVGDVRSAEDRALTAGTTTEVYVCPEGFSGSYKALIRRVWGKVSAGKVTVEVYTHYRGKDQKLVRKAIALEKGEAAIAFDLDGGRRRESLAERQVAAAVNGQMMLNQQVLGQQLAAAVDPQAMAGLAKSRTLADTSGGETGGGETGYPFLPTYAGAVGYQPVIITLPEGTNFAATAVISADRRYVRVSSVPLFSGVAQVHTFNTQTGVSGTEDNRTGGQGYSGVF